MVEGSNPEAGYLSATYRLMAFDSQTRKAPSVSAGIFPMGLSARYAAARFSPPCVSRRCGVKTAFAS
jgi:hypothetical protein